ncbi:MAG TPA: SDR family NAD(P)-dependent oxidoreductase, partial [Gemmatimonadales bacterium]|nr:SDR family NAD(P)-dependent oxidoreductase [Gemmatimonadales bacterium]
MTGKTAIVTGASIGGLGYSMALALAEAGADVAVCDIEARHADLEMTARAIGEAGRRARICCFDVTDGPAVERAVQDTAREWGRL